MKLNKTAARISLHGYVLKRDLCKQLDCMETEVI